MRKFLLTLLLSGTAFAAFGQEIVRSEVFRQRDPSGGMMAIIAMSVVFLALLLIFFVLKVFGKMMVRRDERKIARAAEAEAAAAAPAVKTKKQSVSSRLEAEIAAAALALKMYQEEQHIKESTVITINRASRVYSPWSSKIHGITQVPQR